MPVDDSIINTDLLRQAATLAQVASSLGAEYKQVQDWTRDTEKFYQTIILSKKNGGNRLIRAPERELKEAQRKIAEWLLSFYSPKACVHGYAISRSIKTNALPHVRQHLCLKLDLADFFPSIHFGRIRGILSAAPFTLNRFSASVLAKLCVFWLGSGESELPQGAPTSPILSNLACKGLDSRLIAIAQQYRCTYTRYVDDLTFSTDKRSLPPEVVVPDPERPMRARIGGAISGAVAKSGFRINEAKVRLVRDNGRQLVTGLVVNEKLNVPREFVRNTRGMLHSWKTSGLETASAAFHAKYDSKNRLAGGAPPFALVVRGRIEHIGSVKGWSDRVYLKLARSLSELDDSFEFDRRRARVAASKIVLYVEGKTDLKHIRAALSSLKGKGRYSSLRIEFHDGEGGANLAQMCQQFAKREQQHLSVFLVDRDDRNALKVLAGKGTEYKTWGNNVFSMALPVPSHRQDEENLCIELYYSDADLTRVDENGRRLFLLNEFDSRTGMHSSGNFYTQRPKNSSPILDSEVYGVPPADRVVMSKDEFANAITSQRGTFEGVNFSEFAVIFDVLLRIQEVYLESV